MGIKIDPEKIPAHMYKLLLAYEKGEINTETFLWNLQKESSNLTPQPDVLIRGWNAMLLGWNPDRFSFLKRLKKVYNLYILSNTNDLHLEWMMRDLKRNHNITDFNHRFFEMTFYSNLMKMRKPEKKVFKKVLKEAGIKAEETLFIDDNIDNVLKARKFGIHAICHDPKHEIIETMNDYLESI